MDQYRWSFFLQLHRGYYMFILRESLYILLNDQLIITSFSGNHVFFLVKESTYCKWNSKLWKILTKTRNDYCISWNILFFRSLVQNKIQILTWYRYHLQNNGSYEWIPQVQNIASCIFVGDYILRLYWWQFLSPYNLNLVINNICNKIPLN